MPADKAPTDTIRRAFLRIGAKPTQTKAGAFVDVAGDVPADPRAYAHLLNTLVRVNVWALRRGRYPRLYTSDVVYCREPRGVELWQSTPALLASGIGDCEDLATTRVAELTERRIPARVRLTRKERADGSRLYHVTVWRGEGCVEDPSRRLGMGKV